MEHADAVASGEKKRLRDAFHAIRRAEAARADERLEESLLANLDKIPPLRSALTILMYWSKSDEAPTHHLVDAMLRREKRVALPRTAGRTLEAYLIRSADDLAPGAFGVMEPDPSRCEKVEPGSLDALIVPGVAFDEGGNRLGHGLGFYDRFLKPGPRPGVRIGLCFDKQIHQKPLPHEAHDVKMDFIVSEKRVLRVG